MTRGKYVLYERNDGKTNIIGYFETVEQITNKRLELILLENRTTVMSLTSQFENLESRG